MKTNIEHIFISPDTEIREAMKVITEGAKHKLPVGIVLVTGKNRELLGVVTDGDIRKALVKGAELDTHVSEIMTKNPITITECQDPETMIKTVMKKVKEAGRFSDFKVDKVIVTDSQNRVRDVINFYDLWYKQEISYRRICVVGSGQVGLVMVAVMADAGYEVTGFDVDETLVDELKKGTIRIYEQGLRPILNFHTREGRVTYTSRVSELKSDVFIICVGTPVNEKTKTPDYGCLRQAAHDIGGVLKKEDMIIVRSTVPVGATRNILIPILEKRASLIAGKDFYVVFAPERVVEGRALEETKTIPQVIGAINKKSAQVAAKILQPVTSSLIILDTLEEAEMVKLMNNCFRDISFAFSNNLAILCAALKMDAVKLIKAANEGYPRNVIAQPSPGVGGYCLRKDPFIMAEVAKQQKIDPLLFTASRKINELMPGFVKDKVQKFIKEKWPREKKLKIFIMGFAFKGYPLTSDLRGSSTIDIVNLLTKTFGRKIVISGYDPIVGPGPINRLKIRFMRYEQGFKDAHAVLLLNNNPEFAVIDIFSLLKTMKKPGLFFDGWHFFSPQEIKNVSGIEYESMGGGF